MMKAHLGEREETLSNGDDILHLLNRLNAVLDDLGVLGARCVEDVADTLDVALSPVPVGLLHGLEKMYCQSRCHSVLWTRVCGGAAQVRESRDV